MMNDIQVEYVGRTNNEVKKSFKSQSTYVFKPEIVKVLPKKQNHHEQTSRGICSLFRKSTWNINEINEIKELGDSKRSRSLFLAHDHSHENGKISEPSAEHCVSSRIKHLDGKRYREHPESKKRHNTNGDRYLIGESEKTHRKSQETETSENKSKNLQKSYQNCCMDTQKSNEIIRKGKCFHHSSKSEIEKKVPNKNAHSFLVHENRLSQCHCHENLSGHHRVRIDDVNVGTESICNKFTPRQDSPYPSVNNINQSSPSKENDACEYPHKLLGDFEKCGGPSRTPSKYSAIRTGYFRLNGVCTQDEGNHEERLEFGGKQEAHVVNLLYRSRSLPQLSNHDSGVGSGQENAPGRPNSRLVADLRQLLTLKQHYYPEGGWGWIILVVGVLVQILSHGIHGAIGVLLQHVMVKFDMQIYVQSGWLGAMSTGVALLVSPVTIAFCRRKSTRLTAVFGGLVTALGCLFTSFASQFHQLFFSYGTVVGIGVGMTRDCSTLMVAQYFKRKREFVEIFIVSGSGLGIAVMSAFIKGAISKIGWRLGLQAVTVVVLLTFFLGTFYRSASLYHPQRRAILHLKNQKRKIKDKNKVDDRPPFFDFSTLKSKTVRILLISTGISAFGINTPIFYLAHQAEEEGLGDTVVLLQAYLGLAWTLGCVCFGLLVVHHSVECRIARQYLTQAAVFMCGLCILALTTVNGNYNAYVMFTWIYGIFCGGYHYSLKMYTYERVRARNFAKTWGFVQCSQAIPIAIGVPISGYMNIGCGGKAGYYFSSTCVIVGSFTLFFIDLHRRNLSRHKHTRSNGTKHLCVSDSCPQRRRLSFSQEPENDGVATGTTAAALVLGSDLVPGQGEMMDGLGVDKPELTCISEEGIADMDLPDNILDDLDYIGDCITSCNKVENYLMLSEFENNLIAEMPIIMDRKGRRWSLARSKGAQGSQSGNNNCHQSDDEEDPKPKWRLMPTPNNRVITVIDEASTSHIEN